MALPHRTSTGAGRGRRMLWLRPRSGFCGGDEVHEGRVPAGAASLSAVSGVRTSRGAAMMSPAA